ncbi:MAG TPA: tetratricopeptide repeat protein [Thermoplasmata archaeon]|nr:tetratricopeptide repeat protein [Thermoplasmata archaeon]
MSQQYRLGVQHLLHKEYDRAASAFGNVVRENPTDAQAWSSYGVALTHLGQAAQAELALSKAVALSPRNGEAWFHLGVVRALRDEWSDAASAYRKAVALEPNDLIAWHRLGVALAEAGEEAAASTAFERALVLSREVPSAGATAPHADLRADDHSQEGGEREGSREAKSWLDLALSLLALGDQDEAVAAYERAFTLDPERAGRSLFRPMLRLLTAVGEEGSGVTADTVPPPPVGPSRPEAVRPPRRPEVG